MLESLFHRCFLVKFAKCFRTPFFYRTPLLAASNIGHNSKNKTNHINNIDNINFGYSGNDYNSDNNNNYCHY